MDNQDNLTIRHYKIEDYDEVVSIMVDSFSSKFNAMTSLPNDKTKELIKALGTANQFIYKCHIAEINHKIAGMMLLKWQNQGKPSKSNRRNIINTIRTFGLSNVIKVTLGLSFLDNDVRANECYVEMIAVKEAYRGYGIGTELLRYGRAMVMADPKLEEYTLHVAKSNTGAAKLYEHLGFTTQSVTNSFITRLFYNERTWLYMVDQVKGERDHRNWVMQKSWHLGFLSFISLIWMNDYIYFFQGEGSVLSLIGLLWLLWFLKFFPVSR